MSTEDMQQELLSAITTKFQQVIGIMISDQRFDTSENGVSTDLTIECKRRNWHQSVAFPSSKATKHSQVTIELSLRYNSVGRLQSRLLEKSECYLLLLDDDSSGSKE